MVLYEVVPLDAPTLVIWAPHSAAESSTWRQEFCGSWRTSLHEVASKLTDIWRLGDVEAWKVL